MQLLDGALFAQPGGFSIEPYNPIEATGRAVGDILEASTHFGEAPKYRLGSRIFTRPSTEGGGDAAWPEKQTFHQRMLAELGDATTLAMQPIGAPHTVRGMVRFSPTLDDGPLDTGRRLHVVNRYGDRTNPLDLFDMQREGLSLPLEETDLGEQRGIIVDLPLRTDLSDAQLELALQENRIRVAFAARDWMRASEHPDDPMFGMTPTFGPPPEELLPRIDLDPDPFVEEWRTVFVEHTSWHFIPADAQNDFTSGTVEANPNDETAKADAGRRFVLDLENRRLRILLDRGGILRAYVMPSS